MQSNYSLESGIRTVLTWHIAVFIAKHNGCYIFLQLRHTCKPKQCDSRDMHQIYMKIMFLMQPTNFVKHSIFWEVGRLLTNASHFTNRAHNIPPSATESSLQPTSMRSIATFSSHRRLYVNSGQFLDSLKFLRIYQFPIFSYMLHANLVLWSQDIITSQEKYTKPVLWRTALGRKISVPFPCWVQIFIFDTSFSNRLNLPMQQFFTVYFHGLITKFRRLMPTQYSGVKELGQI